MPIEAYVDGHLVGTLNDAGSAQLLGLQEVSVQYGGDGNGWFFIRRGEYRIGEGYLIIPGSLTAQYEVTRIVPPIEKGEKPTPVKSWLTLKRT